jgi:hypothetical protein
VVDVNINDPHPELRDQFEALCGTRRDEILSHMAQTDDKYEKLRLIRAETSMALKDALERSDLAALFEAYSDAVYAQEIYELDAVYRQALYDAFGTVKARLFERREKS